MKSHLINIPYTLGFSRFTALAAQVLTRGQALCVKMDHIFIIKRRHGSDYVCVSFFDKKWIQIKTFGYLLLLSCLLAGCNTNSKSIEINNAEIPEDFSEFYMAFHTDSSYQMDHILFPLEGRPAADTAIVYDDNFQWQKENWIMHNFDHFDPDLFQVTRKVTDSTLITETIRDTKSGFGIKRRFARFDDKWYLIYYNAMNPE